MKNILTNCIDIYDRDIDIASLFLIEEQIIESLRSYVLRFSGKKKLVPEYRGCLDKNDIISQVKYAEEFDYYEYYNSFIAPTEGPGLEHRLSAKDIYERLDKKTIAFYESGPFFMAHCILFDSSDRGRNRETGIIGQNHKIARGIFQPDHHHKTIEYLRFFEKLKLPVITLMDTPGADAGAAANENLQSHSISACIAEFARINIPTIGIIVGAGNSGGAIPYATTDRILCFEDAYMSTIHPAALADIVQRLGFTKEQCAKFVRISSYELCMDGYVDAIIRMKGTESGESDEDNSNNIALAVLDCLDDIENSIKKRPDILKLDRIKETYPHYLANILNKEIDRNIKKLHKIFSISQGRDDERSGNTMSFVDYCRRIERTARLRMRLKFTTASYWNEQNTVIEQEKYANSIQVPSEEGGEQQFSDYIEKLSSIKISFLPDDFQKAVKREFGSHIIRQVFEFRLKEKRSKRRKHKIAYEFILFLISAHKSRTPEFLKVFIRHISRNFQFPAEFIETRGAEPGNLEELMSYIYPQLVLHSNHMISLFNTIRYCFDNINTLIPSIKLEHELPRSDAESLLKNTIKTDIQDFKKWIFRNIKCHSKAVNSILKAMKRHYPRVPVELINVIEAILTINVPSLYQTRYKAKITPQNIPEDYWIKLDRAYKDAIISNILERVKREKKYISVDDILGFFHGFSEIDNDIVSVNPTDFPEFSKSIKKGLKSRYHNALVTGTAYFKDSDGKGIQVGLIISNNEFQAGSTDMASGEKFARAFSLFGQKGLPVIMFISSGGMQTKEGTGSLYTMSIANDSINKFTEYSSLPVICFAFRDCTGGAQASFVTHPSIFSFYLSGTELPFAGARVVPEPLPYPCRLSNYLVAKPGAMSGLVKNPFDTFLDSEFIKLGDPDLKIPALSITDVISKLLIKQLKKLDEKPITAQVPAKSIKKQHFTKVMIPNRGDVAITLIRKLRRKGITPILGHSRSDRFSLAYTQASIYGHTVELGPGPVSQSYLKKNNIIQAAKTFGAEAIHPGIGFLAENYEFASLCHDNQIVFIGPSPESIRLMGDKAKAREIMAGSGIPVVPGSDGTVNDPESAKETASDIGYPVMLKAAYGGGGRGMRMVFSEDEMEASFSEAFQEAKSSFGTGDIYIEKLITESRHIEVQIVSDMDGNIIILGERDCTVQRNHQKLIEESPSPVLSEELRRRVFEYAEKAVHASRYFSAGTVEFIMDLKTGEIYFMEMNTRLQVEYGVSELVTGQDIISHQINIAQGIPLPVSQDDIKLDGYAMEVRVNAESISKTGDTIPRTGIVEDVQFPEEEWLRVDTYIYPGCRISPYYDSMIAKILIWAPDRDEGIARMTDVLNRTVIKGIPTNIPLQKLILKDKKFQSGIYSTSFLKEFFENEDISELFDEDAESTMHDAQSIFSSDNINVPDSDMVKILANTDGVYYRSPNPAANPFIDIGDIIDSKTTVCLLESMKKYYPIKLSLFTYRKGDDERPVYPCSRYKVVQFLVEDSSEVEKGQAIIIIQPAAK